MNNYDAPPDSSLAAVVGAVFAALLIVAVAEKDETPTSPLNVLETMHPYDIPLPETGRYHRSTLIKVGFLSPEGVESVCRNLGAQVPEGMSLVACANSKGIVAPNPCLFPDERYARLLCHEKAHVLGWKHD